MGRGMSQQNMMPSFVQRGTNQGMLQMGRNLGYMPAGGSQMMMSGNMPQMLRMGGGTRIRVRLPSTTAVQRTVLHSALTAAGWQWETAAPLRSGIGGRTNCFSHSQVTRRKVSVLRLATTGGASRRRV
jgi:hypothetical protein